MNKKKFFLLVFLLCLLFPKFSMAQFDLVHTNLTGLSTGKQDIEDSIFFSMRWSAHLPVQYNPFNPWGDAKLKDLTLAPDIRYWMRESYAGGCCFGCTISFPCIMPEVFSGTVTGMRGLHETEVFPQDGPAPFRGDGTSSSNSEVVLYRPIGKIFSASTAGKRMRA